MLNRIEREWDKHLLNVKIISLHNHQVRFYSPDSFQKFKVNKLAQY